LLCPFCAEEVKDEAIVCKHCTRDIAIPKAVVQKNTELEKQVEELTAEVDQLKRRLMKHEALPAAKVPAPSVTPGRLVTYLFLFTLLPIALLLIAHYVMIIRLDVKVLYLRFVSMALPLPFGFLLFWKMRANIGAAAVIGAIVGLVAVLGMLAVVGYFDNVPVVPRDRQEWQEALEYALSIMLAVVTGYMIGRIVVRYLSTSPRSSGISNSIAREIASFLGPAASDKKLSERIASIEQFLNSLITVATTLGSIFAGIKGVLN
jgi:hypothetical protein